MKTKRQVSYTVTAQLISAFVFATQIEQFLYFLNLKFFKPLAIFYCCTVPFLLDMVGNSEDRISLVTDHIIQKPSFISSL